MCVAFLLIYHPTLECYGLGINCGQLRTKKRRKAEGGRRNEKKSKVERRKAKVVFIN